MSREYFDRILRQEIHLASTLNTSKQSSTHKYHGYLSEIHLSNASKQLEIQQLYNLRKRLDSISDPINEHIRVNYMRNKDITMRNNQQKQCQSLNILIKMIHKKVQQLGYDYRKVSIGGYPDGLFEKMFKIQPSKYMSKAQFVTVMRSVFTLDMNIKTEQSIEMIYNTFDYENKNQLDWRAFLYQLALIIHAYEPVLTHLKMGYAIFSSLGTLVLDSCTEKLQLSTIKDIIEVPIVYSSRSAIRSLIDDCWFELTQNDLEAMEVCHGILYFLSYLSLYHMIDCSCQECTI